MLELWIGIIKIPSANFQLLSFIILQILNYMFMLILLGQDL